MLFININYHFLVSGKAVKNVPVLFVMMASRTTADYKAVFKRVAELVGGVDAWDVRTIMIDFEPAMWSALREVRGHY